MNRFTLICTNFTLVLLFAAMIEGISAVALWMRPFVGALQEGSLQIDRRVLSPVYRDKKFAETIYRDFSKTTVSYQSYSVWTQDEFHGETLNIDGDGLRRTCFNTSDKGVKIYVFGGSTIFGTGVPDCETIPSLLAREIAAKYPGLQFEVINQGITGYQSTQELARLMRLLQEGKAPDKVIFYDGVNDVYAGAYSPGIPGEHQNLDLISSKFNGGLMGWLKRSNTFELLAYVRQRYMVIEPQAAPVIGVSQVYETNLKILEALSRKFNFDYKAYLQPVLLDRSKPVSPFEEQIVSRSGSLNAAYERSYSELRKVAEVDLSRIFSGIAEDLYVDFCHLGAYGNAIVAKALVQGLKF